MEARFSSVLDRTPPAWMCKVEAALLTDVFARAFDVVPPELEDCTSDQALVAFREFTAACMEAALQNATLAERLRLRLGEEAYRLGAKVRATGACQVFGTFPLVRFLYRGIEIELGEDPSAGVSAGGSAGVSAGVSAGGSAGGSNVPANLRFGPCSFSRRYSAADCWFMSAFDEGFIRGIAGDAAAELAFSCRLTEGAPFCRARFGA